MTSDALVPAGLPDYLEPGLRALLIGINPGIASSTLGRHYGGRSNRFWPLLHESGLVPERLEPEDDFRLIEFGLGLTNIVARVTAGSSDLTTEDYRKGGRELVAKIQQFQPGVAVFVGISAFRAMLPLAGQKKTQTLHCGLQEVEFGGVPSFVLPNPSGRNAHYSYGEMLTLWKRLVRWLDRAESSRSSV